MQLISLIGISMRYKFEEALGFLVNITAQDMKNRFANHLKPYNIAPEQFVTMVMLRQNPAVTLTEIANILHKDNTTITRVITALEKKELVLKKRVQEDRRAYSVVLTDKAIDIVDVIQAKAENIKKRQLELFSDEELKILKKSLEKLRNFEF
jgi:DNA-binding MarR family transcriptional regulator